MNDPQIEQPRGILRRSMGEKKFQLSRHLPAADVAFFVEWYWIVRWDLRGQPPYVQETLPHPCVHVVFEPGATRVYGVDTGKFARVLENQGQVLGIKFRPGAFYPFVKFPVARLTDATISFCDVFGLDACALEAAMFAQPDEGAMVAIAESFLRDRLPAQDEQVRVINAIVDAICAHPASTKVADLIDQFGFNKRSLQRLFQRYVGVSPKWVITRFRLHEVAERLASGEALNWANIAGELGYFDQAHFINDFKRVVGRTPAEYSRALG